MKSFFFFLYFQAVLLRLAFYGYCLCCLCFSYASLFLLPAMPTDAMNIAMGSFFPFLLLSGVIWPVEGIPMGLRYISYALPTTWAANSMRSIMSRGWGMEEYDVWMGFAVVSAWILFFFILSVRGLKNRS